MYVFLYYIHIIFYLFFPYKYVAKKMIEAMITIIGPEATLVK